MAVGAAGVEAGAVAQRDYVVSLEPRLHALDAIRLDDERTGDPDEARGRQPSFEIGERFSHQVGVFARVHPRVVFFDVDPVDVLETQKPGAFARHDGTSAWRR